MALTRNLMGVMVVSVLVLFGRASIGQTNAQNAINKVQLVLQRQQYEQDRTLLGREVIATGTLFGEHTGHHHTPVLLTVRTLEALRR